MASLAEPIFRFIVIVKVFCHYFPPKRLVGVHGLPLFENFNSVVPKVDFVDGNSRARVACGISKPAPVGVAAEPRRLY
ncbi:MAG: hypothetical protein ACLUKN_01930 [Bacilli bacterium]